MIPPSPQVPLYLESTPSFAVEKLRCRLAHPTTVPASYSASFYSISCFEPKPNCTMPLVGARIVSPYTTQIV